MSVRGLRAGDLRHRIDIQEKVNTQDPNTGIVTTTWQNRHTSVPAAFRTLSAREMQAAAQRQSQVTAQFTIRSGLTIEASDRIVFDGKNWDIEPPQDDPTLKVFQTIKASQGVSSG